MSADRVKVLDRTLEKTNQILDEVLSDLPEGDREFAWATLRAVLHALRDRLVPDEAIHLSAQLPMLIRGIFFEGWKPSATPNRIRSGDAFLDDVRVRLMRPSLAPETAVRAVFAMLDRHVDRGEIEDVKGSLPAEIRSFWPQGAIPVESEAEEEAILPRPAWKPLRTDGPTATAGELCTRIVRTATADETIRSAARRMAAHAVGTLVVVDERGRPTAMVTDRDIAVRCVARGYDPDWITVRHAMSRPLAVIEEGASIERSLQEMNRRGVRRLVVTDEGGFLVGVLALDDLLEVLVEEASLVKRLIDRQTRAV